MEMPGFCFAGLSPGLFELSVAAEPVDPGVAVAVGDVNISRGAGRYFSAVVEGSRRPRHQVARIFASGVREDPAIADNLQGFAVQGELDRHLV